MNAPVVTAEAEIVSKAEFARLCNVSRARVAQWLVAKKICGDAIVGEGRGAQIHVARARAQLRLHLDISQRMGNGLSTQLDGPAPPSSSALPQLPLDQASNPQVQPSQRPPDPPRDPIEEQIKRERLETARRINRKMAEEEAARAGRYMLSANVTKWVGRTFAELVGLIDGWLSELASKIAAKFGLPQRDILHLLRSEFRLFRTNIAAHWRREAERHPEFIEDNPLAEDGTPPIVDEHAAADGNEVNDHGV